MSQYLTYVIAQGDTIETISQSQLKINLTRAIISLNVLRYPFISDDPIDQYAHSKGQLQLISPISGSTITLGNLQSLKLDVSDTIFFRDITIGIYESAVVSSFNTNSDGSVTITLSSPMQNSYNLSATATLFTNQQNIPTKVLKTGDTIYLPATIDNISSANLNTSNIFGTDIYLDNLGFMQRDGVEIKTISGVDNVAQSVTMRWRTPAGQFPGDDLYGNRMFDLIGEENTPYYQTLAAAFIKQSALSDPRVSDITISSISSIRDSTQISGDIKAVNTGKSVPVSTSILTGGTL